MRDKINDGEIKSWDQVALEFNNNFLGKTEEVKFSNYLKKVIQPPNESVSSFILRLYLSLNKNMEVSEQERLIREKLRNKYQMGLAMHDIRTMEDLCNTCLIIEAGIAAPTGREFHVVGHHDHPEAGRLTLKLLSQE